jgi:predicted nucleic acid-binding protein
VIVLDASAALEVLLRTEAASAVEQLIFDGRASLHAPHLIDLEIAQVLRRYSASGKITGTRGRQALEDLTDFPLTRYPHDFLLPRIWELRRNVTAYDAAYLALAETLGAVLVTRDARLGAAPGCRARVLVV